MRTLSLVAAALLPTVLVLSACAPKDDGSSASSGSSATASSSASASASTCTPAALAKAGALTKQGTLTVATDSPAYPPWFEDNKPTNGKGYESAVAYAVAKKLGFSQSQVSWVKEPFNNSYAPGPKNFDFDINQISITTARAKVVDFSTGYYSAAQAVIALKGSAAAKATSPADLAKLKLGAQTGTTSLTAIRDDVKPAEDPLVFDDTNVAKQALLNGQVDAIVADLPTALYITATELSKGVIIGQFKSSGTPEQFGMLAAKGSKLVPCLDYAVAQLTQDGTLASLEKTWLSESVSVPVLTQS
ncbi:amino acid ABC transporter substrate-binding protein [Nocardioides mangrovicus]|uniref:Amino acid ABC transporter substrate-binding protein n=1 Tax=Nocardioides mangrovicus TaxID=2478913 RepID=A0A3L8NZ07_9ACTN|nr:ABC transporter substrate-binding protein [Nocardioides mangrovicus]RLV48011.1 amino acid ABC transporter substrate-binding protein [Nocardioides mangrovicus]